MSAIKQTFKSVAYWGLRNSSILLKRAENNLLKFSVLMLSCTNLLLVCIRDCSSVMELAAIILTFINFIIFGFTPCCGQQSLYHNKGLSKLVGYMINEPNIEFAFERGFNYLSLGHNIVSLFPCLPMQLSPLYWISGIIWTPVLLFNAIMSIIYIGYDLNAAAPLHFTYIEYVGLIMCITTMLLRFAANCVAYAYYVREVKKNWRK